MPLVKLSTAAAFEELFTSSRTRKAEVSQRLIAAFVYSRTNGLKGSDAQLRRAMDELALFALSQDASLLSKFALPSSGELASAMGRSAWVESLNAAARAMSTGATPSRYAALVMGPADVSGTAPAPSIRHWAMALDPTKVKRVAGPLVSAAIAREEGQRLFLWGLARPVTS